MLYLEDYLEMIEHLPSELQDRFTDMREMDLSVQNRMDSLEKRQKQFFLNCVQNKKFKGAEREEEYERIRKEYAKVIEDAAEKVNLAEDSYGLVDKYLRRLDDELLKFKLELEADNRGITEILEKRSLEMDQPSATSSNHKENRHPKKSRKHHLTTVHSIPGSSGGSGVTVAHQLGPAAAAATGNKVEQRKSTSNLGQVYSSVTGDSLSLDTMQSLSPSSTGTPGAPTGNANTYPLQHMGAGGNAIAQAASQAIAATQQLTGRRTSSLKASFEAINLGLQTHEFSIGGELASAAQSALVASALSGPSTSSSMGSSPGEQSGAVSTKRKKMSKSTCAVVQNPVLDVGGIIDESLINPGFGGENSPTTEELLSGSRTGDSGTPDQDWYDPSEPRYCICNQISYGDMVACDNEDCLYEWFHYPCVGITAPPKGKWYCPTCTANMARRKGRKLTI